MSFGEFPNFGAGVGGHHREIGDEGVYFAGEFYGAFHAGFVFTGQTDDEKAHRFQLNGFGVFKGASNGVMVNLFINGE